MRILDQHGQLLDAEFDIEPTSDGVEIVLHSKSGNTSGGGRNPDYFVTLEHLLSGLAGIGAIVRSVAVDSTVARKLMPQERLIDLPYPLRLTPATDASALRIQITEGQRTIASNVPAGGPGGNKHKRIRLAVDLTEAGITASDLLRAINAEAQAIPEGSVGHKYKKARANPTVRPADVFTYDPSARERALAGHARVQNALAERLVSLGLEPRSPAAHEPDFDLGWVSGGIVVVAEVKSLTGSDPVQQLRLGLGQVLHYRRSLADIYGDASAVLAVEHEPPAPWLSVCADVGVQITWPPSRNVSRGMRQLLTRIG